MDLVTKRIDLEITENIKNIMQKWSDSIKTPIDVFSMDDLPENLSGLKNNLAVSQWHQITGFFMIYTSENYPEAHIIHEILHPLLRANNYVEMSPLNFGMYLKYPHIMKQVKSFAMSVTNQMDHLVIHQQMKEYDLDFERLAILEFEDGLKLECNPIFENELERIVNNMLIGLNYFDYIDMIEPYRSKLIKILKEGNEEAYKYGTKFYKLVSNNGYLTQEEYRRSMEILLEEMKRTNAISNGFFDLLRIK